MCGMNQTIRLSLALLALATVQTRAALPGADALAKLITSQFDTNSDDILDSGEWQSGVADGFDKMDENSDGDIADAEVDALSGDIANETGDIAAVLVTALVKKVVFTLDADANKLVSKKEYLESAEGIFKKLDANSDGQVTQEELAELPTKVIGG
jgi:Ca2+-binding EF-hand superfamily protein